MTFIDWSDFEGMFQLLIEFVTDERNESSGDPKRHKFLSQLLLEFDSLSNSACHQEIIDRLKRILQSIDKEFQNDCVTIHISDCIDELTTRG